MILVLFGWSLGLRCSKTFGKAEGCTLSKNKKYIGSGP